MNNSVRRREAKQLAKLTSQAERVARGWVHPADRPPKPKPSPNLSFVQSMIRTNNLFSKVK